MAKLLIKKIVLDTLCEVLQLEAAEVLKKFRANSNSFSKYVAVSDPRTFEATRKKIRDLASTFSLQLPYYSFANFSEFENSEWTAEDLRKLAELACTVEKPSRESQRIVQLLGSDNDSLGFQELLKKYGIAPKHGRWFGPKLNRFVIGGFLSLVAGFIWWRFSTAETNLPETNTSLKQVVNATDLQPAETEVTTAPQSLTGTLLPLKIDLSVSASRYQTLQKLLAHPEEYLSESEYQTVLSHLSSSLISRASFFELSARIPSAHFSRRRVSVNLPATPEDSQWVWFAIPSSGEPGRLPEVGLGANPVNLDLADEWVEIVLVVFSRSELRRKSLEITIEG